jgi:transcriptional regulator with XRE-family HTH domain
VDIFQCKNHEELENNVREYIGDLKVLSIGEIASLTGRSFDWSREWLLDDLYPDVEPIGKAGLDKIVKNLERHYSVKFEMISDSTANDPEPAKNEIAEPLNLTTVPTPKAKKTAPDPKKYAPNAKMSEPIVELHREILAHYEQESISYSKLSRMIGINVKSITEFLQGKRTLSPTNARKIRDYLDMTPAERIEKKSGSTPVDTSEDDAANDLVDQIDSQFVAMDSRVRAHAYGMLCHVKDKDDVDRIYTILQDNNVLDLAHIAEIAIILDVPAPSLFEPVGGG